MPTGTAMNGVAYGNGVYVAVGAAGYLIKSTDAVHWVIQQTSATFLDVTYSKVIFANGKFVAITQNGLIITSADGTNWMQRTSNVTVYLYDIVYASGKFVVVGINSTILSSADGITWTTIGINAAGTEVFISVVYTAGKFVIGSTTGTTVYYSSTAATNSWTKVAITNVTGLNKLYLLNTTMYIFTSASNNTNIYTSTDGISWSVKTDANITYPNQMFHGFYDGTTYFLFGNSSVPGYSYGSVFTSTDGVSYTLQAKSTSIVCQGAFFVNGKYFQVGNEGMVVSTNGSDWAFPGASFLGVTTNGSTHVAVGMVTSNDAAIFTSTDWINWTNRSAQVLATKTLNGVVYGGGKFVAVGNVDAATYGTVATSSDGITWTIGNSGVADALRAIAYGNSKYVAVGLNGRIIYSSNGTSWTSVESNNTYGYYGVSFINNVFVAVGGSTAVGGAAKVKYSTNGVTWTDVSPTVVGHFQSVTYGGGRYVLVGRDNTSGSQKFLSDTTSNITSSAGFGTPVSATSLEGDIGAAQFGGVAYGNNSFVAVSNLKVSPFTAYILNSTDGVTWTVTKASTFGRMRNVIYTGSNNFRAVGIGDTKLNITSGAALPLKLLQFNAQPLRNEVLLTWKASGEVNTSHFEIESSTGGSIFNKIGVVAAAGNSIAEKGYSFIHTLPPSGINDYRLKMIDIDGNFTYSEVKRISISTDKQISVYPNPVVDNELTIEAATSILPVNFTIYDNNGKKVKAGQLAQKIQKVNISTLGKGLYTIQFGNGFSQKISKP